MNFRRGLVVGLLLFAGSKGHPTKTYGGSRPECSLAPLFEKFRSVQWSRRHSRDGRDRICCHLEQLYLKGVT
ncbi:hypothetical protein M758_11G067700 [Ceratodon purpureus]|uniref:Secreted protein n=1 Tax=Ceratodon purpureus TaxID=3225 RepID=A0A8T0GDQ5_CERPU|nr:hypothetical protein KC19_11G069600 [Ceratodon purpureus]KAG0600871.1 hypothetical protein M758_11G067700 [Ceratodon purpureus]